MISIIVEVDHRGWDKHLIGFRHAINTAMQFSTKKSPSFLNFGRHPRSVKSLRREVEAKPPLLDVKSEIWQDRVKRLDALRDLVLKYIDEAGEKRDLVYNKGRREVYNVGDQVMVRVYQLSNAGKGINAKLLQKYCGPHVIKWWSNGGHQRCTCPAQTIISPK